MQVLRINSLFILQEYAPNISDFNSRGTEVEI